MPSSSASCPSRRSAWVSSPSESYSTSARFIAIWCEDFAEHCAKPPHLAFALIGPHINSATARCACRNSSLTWAACASRRPVLLSSGEELFQDYPGAFDPWPRRGENPIHRALQRFTGDRAELGSGNLDVMEEARVPHGLGECGTQRRDPRGRRSGRRGERTPERIAGEEEVHRAAVGLVPGKVVHGRHVRQVVRLGG